MSDFIYLHKEKRILWRFPSSLPDPSGRAVLVCAAVLFAALLAVFHLSQVFGGQTWDEQLDFMGVSDQIQVMTRLLNGDLSAHFTQVRSNFAFYGIIAVLPAYLAERLAVLGGAANPFGIYTYVLHATAFAAYLLTIVLTYLILLKVTATRVAAAAGSLLLALYPLWLGSAFFNHKDMPTAAGVLLAVQAAVMIIYGVGDRRILLRGAWLLVIATILTGGLKIPALVLIIPPWVTVLLLLARGRHFSLMARICAASTAGILMATPVAWSDPLNFVFQSLMAMSRHEWNGCTLSAGVCMAPHTPEWSAAGYIWTWYMAQIPLLIGAGAVLGLLLAPLRGAAQATIAATLALPLLLIMARNSTLYDGLRHLLFTIPLIFILATNFWCEIGRRAGVRLPAVLAVVLPAFFTWDNFRMFPYSYISFNLVTRQLADTSNFETDYWGFSLREAANLPHVTGTDLPVLGNPVHLVAPYAPPPGRAVFSFYDAGTLDAGTAAVVVSYARGQPVPPWCTDPQYVTRALPAGGRPLLLSFAAKCVIN